METTREVVGVFEDRAGFERAVRALREAGFAGRDLSVLSSHESIDVAAPTRRSVRDVLVALVGEIRFEAPLVAAGAILIAGGPVAATIAAIIGAGVGGLALKEVLEEVTSTPHTEDFARAVEAGSIILWARVEDEEKERTARAIFHEHGGTNIHLHAAAPQTP